LCFFICLYFFNQLVIWCLCFWQNLGVVLQLSKSQKVKPVDLQCLMQNNHHPVYQNLYSRSIGFFGMGVSCQQHVIDGKNTKK